MASGSKKEVEIDVFTQLEDALEERGGKDRRQQNQGSDTLGVDRRKNDRRNERQLEK